MSPKINNIFASLLIAGIIGMLSWFVSHLVYHPHELKEDAYPIAAAESGAGAAPAAAEPTTAEPIDALMASADPAKGAQITKVCSACHSFDQGGPNRVGPNLWGIVGNHHAHKDDYAYSEAMLSHKGEQWTVDTLNQFLWSPKKTIPGTKMSFAGLKKPEDRAAVIKWLETQK